MKYPIKSSWGFSTHYEVTNGKESFILSARFHPKDKCWVYVSDNGEFIGLRNGESIFDKAYTILNQWYDADHWYNEITYIESKVPVEYNEGD